MTIVTSLTGSPGGRGSATPISTSRRASPAVAAPATVNRPGSSSRAADLLSRSSLIGEPPSISRPVA